jgi:hypothetical protein
MIRRDFLRRILYGGTTLAATGAAGTVIEPPLGDGAALAHDLLNLTATDLQTKHSLPTLTALPFPLEDVRILDPDLLRMRDSSVMVVKLSDLLREGVNGRKIHTMFIDSAGISGAVGSRLRQLGHGNVIEINFGADSPDQHYANMRAYMWGKAKEWLLTGAIDADPRLECDLTGPGYVVDNKIRVRLESKEDMKKRGLDSPDHGDALALSFAQTVAAPRIHEPGPLLRPVSVWN